MQISIIIGIMIAIVVGIFLIPMIVNTTNQIEEEMSPALKTMLSFLPWVFISVIALGVILIVTRNKTLYSEKSNDRGID